VQQEVVLAMLAKEPSHGYQLRARLRDALGPLGDAMNAGQVYVTLTRLEKAGLLAVERSADGADRSDRKVYALTPNGQHSESPSGSPRWAGPDPTWRSSISS
jgi:DNA-binding PadR family transcriptional regulator